VPTEVAKIPEVPAVIKPVNVEKSKEQERIEIEKEMMKQVSEKQ
jgi:hypothetical protein